jgi:hypothetical protein
VAHSGLPEAVDASRRQPENGSLRTTWVHGVENPITNDFASAKSMAVADENQRRFPFGRVPESFLEGWFPASKCDFYGAVPHENGWKPTFGQVHSGFRSQPSRSPPSNGREA